MSLINDALRRAKKAQEHAPVPPPDLPFRPVEPSQQRNWRGLGLLLPAALAVVACLVLFLVWQWVHRSGDSTPTEVAARTALASQHATIAPAPVPAPVDAGAAALATAPSPSPGAAAANTLAPNATAA